MLNSTTYPSDIALELIVFMGWGLLIIPYNIGHTIIFEYVSQYENNLPHSLMLIVRFEKK
jgi:hypothetical protein